MSRSRLFATSIAAATVLILLVSPLARASAQGGVTTGWWWALQTKGDRLPSTLPPGSMPVSRVGPNYEKLPAVRFEIPADAAHGVLTLQANTDPTLTVGSGMIVACPLVTPFLAKDAQVWSNRPAGDCTNPVYGAAEGSSWRFDVSRLVEQWANGTLPNHGVIFVPVATMQRSTFQVVFNRPEIGALDFTAPQVPVNAPGSVPAPTEVTRHAPAAAVAAPHDVATSSAAASIATPELSPEALADIVRLVEAPVHSAARIASGAAAPENAASVDAPVWLAAVLLLAVAGAGVRRHRGELVRVGVARLAALRVRRLQES